MTARRLLAATTARVLFAESCAPRRYGSYAGVSAWVAPSTAAAWAVGTGGAAGLLRPPLGLLPNGARGAKTEASKLRKGQYVKMNDRTYEVLACNYTQGRGRQSGNVQLELRDAVTGNKANEKTSPDDIVDTVIVDLKKFQFLYESEGEMILMDPDTFEQMELSSKLAEGCRKWICESTPVHVDVIDGAIVGVRVPAQVEFTVVEADPKIKSGTADGKGLKGAVLACGVSVMVPAYIEQGDVVLVSTEDTTFLKRISKGG